MPRAYDVEGAYTKMAAKYFERTLANQSINKSIDQSVNECFMHYKH